jgi:NAD(P)-dependent dehydrogenase (short-subunit alcohol dehydrogenase family)
MILNHSLKVNNYYLSIKTIVITGTIGGTGYAFAEICIKIGCDTVVLLNPQSDPSESTAKKLQDIGTQSSSKTTIVNISCDLQAFSCVKSAINTIKSKSKYDSIDILCNHAGVMAVEDVKTKDGYEIQMQTNHLSHFYFTNELFPLLQTAVENMVKHGLLIIPVWHDLVDH